jgi:hypothetical protein
MKTFAQDHEFTNDIYDALQILTELERDIVILRCYEDMPFVEIARLYEEYNNCIVYPKDLYNALNKMCIYFTGEDRKPSTLKSCIGINKTQVLNPRGPLKKPRKKPQKKTNEV